MIIKIKKSISASEKNRGFFFTPLSINSKFINNSIISKWKLPFAPQLHLTQLKFLKHIKIRFEILHSEDYSKDYLVFILLSPITYQKIRSLILELIKKEQEILIPSCVEEMVVFNVDYLKI